MTPREQLTNGIIAMQGATVPEGVYGTEYDAVIQAAHAYANLLINGQWVEWCEVHNHRQYGDEPACVFVADAEGDDPCRIVSKLLIDLPDTGGSE